MEELIKKVCIITNNVHCERHVQYYSTIEKYFTLNGWKVKKDFNVDKIVICGCGFHDAMIDKINKILSDVGKTNFLEKNLILAGCAPKTHESTFIESFKGNIVYINQERELDEIISAEYKFANIESVNKYKLKGMMQDLNIEYDKFHIKISQGCLKKCTFCVINKAKGFIKSVPVNKIDAQIQKAIDNDCEKIFLMGEDTFAYGYDINDNIINLIEHISIKFPNVKLYFGYLHIKWLQEYYEQILSLCKRGILSELHIGLQHVDEEVLESMGRPANFENLYKIIKTIKKECPDIHLVADIMVGFPGETEEKFNKLISFFQEDNCFDKIKHFGYSDVLGAPSSEFGDKVPTETIAKRWELLDNILNSRAYASDVEEERLDDETFKITRFKDYNICVETFDEVLDTSIVKNEFVKAKSKIADESGFSLD